MNASTGSRSASAGKQNAVATSEKATFGAAGVVGVGVGAAAGRTTAASAVVPALLLTAKKPP